MTTREDGTMMTADEARGLTREATNRDSGTLAGRIAAERRAFKGTWRGRRRLARVRRGIEREARRGGRCVDVLVGPYVRAMALSDYLSDHGYHTGVNTIGNNYEVRVSW
jgi:hypothetical protein